MLLFRLQKPAILFALTLLSACGGAGSESGGLTSARALKSIGTQSIVLSTQGSVLRNQTSVQLSFDPMNETVRIDDADFRALAKVTAGAYRVSSPTLNIDIDAATRCSGAVIYSGRINPSTTSGNLSGSISCNGIVYTVSGVYSAEAISSKIIPIADSISDAVRGAL